MSLNPPQKKYFKPKKVKPELISTKVNLLFPQYMLDTQTV